MKEFERQDLAELILRWQFLSVEAAHHVHATPFDAVRLSELTEMADEARRQVWNLLYGIVCEPAEGQQQELIDRSPYLHGRG